MALPGKIPLHSIRAPSGVVKKERVLGCCCWFLLVVGGVDVLIGVVNAGVSIVCLVVLEHRFF